MIRQVLKNRSLTPNKEFRFRGEEPGRLENFSDAVFALAITLLLISTSPPTNFDQIRRFAWEVIPFCCSITLIILIWHEHFVFYYRYGLRNGRILVLNTIFLIIVLFYVYPLKFLFKVIMLFPIALLLDHKGLLGDLKGMIKPEDMGDLMIIYGLGASGIFFVLVLMYRYAFKNADALELNEIERFDTKTSIYTNLLMGSIPLLSTTLAFIFRGHWLAGMVPGCTYFLYAPIMMYYGNRVERRRKQMLSALPLQDSVEDQMVSAAISNSDTTLLEP